MCHACGWRAWLSSLVGAALGNAARCGDSDCKWLRLVSVLAAAVLWLVLLWHVVPVHGMCGFCRLQGLGGSQCDVFLRCALPILLARGAQSYYTNQPNTPFMSTNRRGTILGKYDGKLAVANNEQGFSMASGMHLRYHIRLLDVDTGRIVSHSYYTTREASWIEPQSVVMYPGATSADPGTMLIVCGLVGYETWLAGVAGKMR